jgi:tape measure domain-containing protein
MSKVDSRIVTMKFDNAQFEKGVATTMATMSKLKDSMTFDNAKKGLTNLQDGINKVNFGSMEGGIDGISKKFMAMSTIAITALMNITNRLVDMGINMAKSLTIDPIKAGFDEYELKLGSIQTILANTQKYGTTLGEVTTALDGLNAYADKTIYNFGDMTKNIGLFTNAGIKIEDATSMIKGFSNSAAASGTSAEGAASAAYQLSQALSAGKVTLMDWKSLTNVGMGNKNMQQGIIDIASAMGTFKGTGIGAKDAAANFNATLEKGWLSADVMSNYLKIMAGDMDAAAMASMGLSQAQIDTFIQQQKTAEEAATKVRTFTQLIGTMREAVGSGWSQTFELVIGNFDEATELFTDINNAVSGFIGASADARNKVIGDWKALGGRTMLIAGIKNVFVALGNIIKPIKDAFREIFPKKTGEQLFRLTAAFTAFTNKLKLSDKGMENLKKTFKGIFSIVSIFTTIVKEVLGLVGKLLGAMFNFGSTAGGGLLAFTGSLGEGITKVADFIKSSEIIPKIFDKIAQVLTPIISLGARVRTIIFGIFSGGIDKAVVKFQEALTGLQPVMDWLWEAFRKFNHMIQTTFPEVAEFFGFADDSVAAATGISTMNGAMGETVTVIDRIKTAWAGLRKKIAGAGPFFEGLWDNIKKGLGWLKDKIAEFISGLGVQEGLALVNTGFFIMLYRSIKKFTDKLGGIVDSVIGTLDQVTANLKTMQQDVKANMILKIAIAIGVLALALFVLSKIDNVKIAVGLGAIAVVMKIMMGAMTQLKGAVNMMSVKDTIKMNLVALSLIGFGIALLAVSAAIKVFGSMSWSELIKGVIALKVVLQLLVNAAAVLSDTGAKDLLIASIALGVIAAALLLLAAAFKVWDAIDASTFFDAVWKIALALGVMAVALRAMAQEDVLAGAAALFVASAALIVLATAIHRFDEIGGGAFLQSMTFISVGLYILIKAINAVGKDGIRNAAAILVVAAALVVMAIALKLLGSLSLGQLGIALLAIAGIFVILGLAAFILAPLAPVIEVLAIAVALLGVGMLAAGAGLLLFSMGVAALVVSGAAGVAAMSAMVVGLAMLIPLIAQQIGLGIIAFVVVIRDSAPIIGEAITALLNAALQSAIDVLPKFGEFMKELIETMLDVLVEEIPNIVDAGREIVISLLEGLAEDIPRMADAATDVITAFLDAIGDNSDEVIDAGFQMIEDVLNGIADGIEDHMPGIKAAGKRIGKALLAGLLDILPGGAGGAVAGMLGITTSMIDTAEEELEIHSPSRVFMRIGQMVAEGLALGVKESSYQVENAVANLGDNSVSALKSTMQTLADVISSDVDINPTITPVLDLSKVEKDASNINSLLAANAVAANISYDQAAFISSTQRSTQQADTTTEVTTPAPVVQFEQNNYSPKALSTVEIYRQTRNQLSLAKEALKV